MLKNKTLKDYLAIAGTNIILQPIQLIKSIVVAKFLGPDSFGILKSLELIQMLDKYGNLGFRAAAAREIGNAKGRGDLGKEIIVRNNAYSGEIILSLFLFLTGCISSIIIKDETISLMLLISSFSLLFSKLRGIFNTEVTIQKKFIFLSKVTFGVTLLNSLLIILTVPYFGVYSVISANALIGFIAIIIYLLKLKFEFSFEIDKKEMKRILKISIPLTISTLSLGSFKYAERLIIIILLGQLALGYYGFAVMVQTTFLIIFKSAIKVRVQDLYELVGNGNYRKVNSIVIRETLLLFFGSMIIIPVVIFSIKYFIPWLLPKWSEGIIYAQIYILMLFPEVLPLYASNVLISATVDKVRIIYYLRFLSTALLLGLTYFFNILGKFDLISFIYINIISHLFYSLSIVFYYKKYFFNIYIKNFQDE